MKTIRIVIFLVFAGIFGNSVLDAHDLSGYRNFSLGMSLTDVLKLTDRNLTEVKTNIEHPGLIQDLNWWPPMKDYQADVVQQILFSFYNGELYKIRVTYDPSAVKGLTAEDMVQSISVRYGASTTALKGTGNPANEQYSQQAIAIWEDPQYSLKLIHTPYSGGYGLILFSKHANTEAESASVEAGKLEARERPQKEADRRKKEADSLEIERQKNKKAFQP
jgi:hypothetical protein